MAGLWKASTSQSFSGNKKVRQINYRFPKCALKLLPAFNNNNGIYYHYCWSSIMYQALFNEKLGKIPSLGHPILTCA